jgi:hypothetical protein
VCEWVGEGARVGVGVDVCEGRGVSVGARVSVMGEWVCERVSVCVRSGKCEWVWVGERGYE